MSLKGEGAEKRGRRINVRTGEVGNSRASIDIQGEKFSVGRQATLLVKEGEREGVVELRYYIIV